MFCRYGIEHEARSFDDKDNKQIVGKRGEMLNNRENMQRSRRRRAERDRTVTLPLLLLLILALSGTTKVAEASDDIEYWTDYAIYPKACVNYNDMDQILYAIHEKSSNHCTDNPVGTFVSPVPTFVDAYIDQLADNAADAGEEYEYPDLMNYLDCTYKNIAGGDYYIQLGCSDDDTSSLAVNIYTDAQCTESSEDLYGGDDANVEIDFALKYQCTPCVHWGDKNDDQIDDQYYQNKQTNAPLCGAMWDYRQECSGKCLMLAKALGSEKEGWNKADRILLSILGLFGEFSIALVDAAVWGRELSSGTNPTFVGKRNRIRHASGNHKEAAKHVEKERAPRAGGHIGRRNVTKSHPGSICATSPRHHDVRPFEPQEDHVDSAIVHYCGALLLSYEAYD